MVKNCLGWRAVGRWFIAANEDVGGCWHWPPETQYRRAHFGAETLCIVVKRAGRWLLVGMLLL